MKHSHQTNPEDKPATLYGVMQQALGKELRSLYPAKNELPHELLVLAMQLNDDRRQNSKSQSHKSKIS